MKNVKLIIGILVVKESAKKNVSSVQLAKKYKFSQPTCSAVCYELKNSGILTADKGKFGGYKLQKPASEITAYDVVYALEGTIRPVNCLENISNCVYEPLKCSVIKLWEGLDKIIRDYLSQHTIEDIIIEMKAKHVSD